MIVLAALLVLIGTEGPRQFVYQKLLPNTFDLDLWTTGRVHYHDAHRREADHIVVSNDGKNLAVWSDQESGVLIGQPAKGFQRYLADAPPPDPHFVLRDRGAPPRCSWCFDGQHGLLAFFPDSRVIESLDLKSGRTSRDDFTNSLRLVPTYRWEDSGTSGCKIRLSPDGSLAAITTASRQYADEIGYENETATYVISRKGVHAKYLSLGSPVAWLDPRRLLVWHSKGNSGDLFVVDTDGKVIARKPEISLAIACPRGDIYVSSVTYAGNYLGPPRLFKVAPNLRGDALGQRMLTIPGAKWWAMRNDAVAAFTPR